MLRAPSSTESSDLAKLNHRKSLCRLIQLCWRHSGLAEKAPDSLNTTIGFSRADGTVDGNQSGARPFCASIFGLSRCASEYKRDSDGTRSGKRTRLCCGVW